MRSIKDRLDAFVRHPIVQNGFACLILALIILLPRLPGLADFVTVDEGTRSLFNANFYYALGQRDFAATYQEYTPGITTMWVGTLALLLYFPAYRGLGQGQIIKGKEFQFSEFLFEHGKDPLAAIVYTRVLLVLAVCVLLLILYVLLGRLLNRRVAFFAVAYLSVSPFFLGHSRLINDEALMAIALLIAVVALIIFQREQNGAFLLLSGAFAAFAFLTKSSAIFVLPLVGLILVESILLESVRMGRLAADWSAISRIFRSLLIWLLVVVSLYVLLWPGMWVQPGGMLNEVYGTAFSYAFSGSRPEVEVVSRSAAGLSLDGVLSYLRSLLASNHLLTWIGGGAALIVYGGALFKRGDATRIHPKSLRIVMYFAVLAALYIVGMGVVGGRNSAHYILTAHAALGVIAALGLIELVDWMLARVGQRWRSSIPVLLGLAVVMQLTAAFSQYPYYYTYTNGLLHALTGYQAYRTGYGEGLELAGAYLSTKDNAEDLTVLSWYGYAFSFFFPGNVEHMHIAEVWEPAHIDRLEKADYLVLYYTHQQSRNMPAKLLADLEGVPIEQSIWLNGFEAVRIYDVSLLPDRVYVPAGTEETDIP